MNAPAGKYPGPRSKDDAQQSLPAAGTLYTDGGPVAATWLVPEEVPVAIMFNSKSYAVMMATPADLEDFAVGFALSEGIVKSAGHIRSVLVLRNEHGLTADLSVDTERLDKSRMVNRNLEGRVGCGLCGIEDIKDAIRLPGAHTPAVSLLPQAVASAYESLPDFQPMYAVNRTVHAAAWCNSSGSIHFSREDVGRHNALDKLIGAMARGGVNPADGFVLMSSRCSFELVQKCALAGIGALATISAPTALALSLARQSGVKLAALSRGGVMIFDEDETDGRP